MKLRPVWVKLVTSVTLVSGVTNIASVIIHHLPHRLAILTEVLPLGFVHLSKFFTLLIGFALVISSLNIYKRKRNALNTVFLLSVFSIIFHLTKGLNYEEALVSLILVIILIFTRKYFTVKSSLPSLRWGLIRLGTAITVALGYGIAGFWFLHRRDFGIEFHIGDSIRETLLYLAFVGDPRLLPQTHYANWFLDSLYLITAVTLCYSIYAVFRPVIYQFQVLPKERSWAKEIVGRYGRSAIDFFKYWPDKSYFFLPSQNSFIAYRVGNNFAMALADPVGPDEEIEVIVREFMTFCEENDWGVGFHQALPDFLPIYQRLGFRKFKIGEDAIVDLSQFNLNGRDKKVLRHTINKMEASRIQFIHYRPPIPDDILLLVKEVSDDWLKIPGRRERQFTLGIFELDYIRSSSLYVVTDVDRGILAFANQIPSFHPGEATIDLMRRRSDAPGGVMDFLFIKLFFHLKKEGYVRFNLGMAPMSSFQEEEEASFEENAIRYFMRNLNFLFSYRGISQYKAKFASGWEPRYVIYRNPLDLPRMALALRVVSESKS